MPIRLLDLKPLSLPSSQNWGHLVHTCQLTWDKLHLREIHLSSGKIETLPEEAEEHEFYESSENGFVVFRYIQVCFTNAVQKYNGTDIC